MGADSPLREVVHIIAKLRPVEYPLLPQVEELSMRMAAVACVNVCGVKLVPLKHVEADQPFVLGGGRKFLTVRRLDRARTRNIQCEDFALILGAASAEKYQPPGQLRDHTEHPSPDTQIGH